jgi:hypothetical protein
MMLPAIAIALLLQAAPASISGVVMNSAGIEPVANVRVSLARTDAALGAFGQMLAGDRPPAEVTLPGEFLTAMSERSASYAANSNNAEANAEAKAIGSLGVANIAEVVLSANGDVAVVYKSTPPVQTDSQGRFAFTNIEPGTYKLIFSASGFARQDYGQRDPGGTGIPIVLAPAQVRNDIVMRMTQVSAVSGRIADAAGRPVAGVPVQLFRFAYDETGKRKVQPVADAQSDDRGLYRMFSLSPGRYFLSAGNPLGNNNGLNDIITLTGDGTPMPAANGIPQKYSLSYYPGAPELNSATAIDVPSGADVRGIDMYLKEQQTYRVRGVIMDPRSGQPPRSASILLNPQNPDPRSSPYVSFGDNLPNYSPADGAFELRNVSPGAYIVSAQLPNPVATPPNFASMTADQQRAYFDVVIAASTVAPRAFTSINVVNSDIENVQLWVGTAGSISGTLRAELPPNTSAPDFNFIHIQLRLADGSTPSNAPSMRPPKDDGTFRIDGVWPGEYYLVLSGLPAGFYLKQALLGDLDLLNGGLRFTGSESAALNIVISSNTGVVDGNVSDAQGQPLSGARVVLIPERNRERTELFRPGVSDPSGHFRITGVAPGDYKLAAWDTIEPFAFFDPDLLKQADDKGKGIRVAESSKQSVNIAVIPR